MTRHRLMGVVLLAAVIVGTLGIATRFVSADQARFGLQTTASPEASPAASPSANAAVTVEMIDIAFNPTAFTIPANTDVTVTLPNNGVAIHSFVINEHNNEGKPNLNIRVEVAPGAVATVTINAPAGENYLW